MSKFCNFFVYYTSKEKESDNDIEFAVIEDKNEKSDYIPHRYFQMEYFIIRRYLRKFIN